MSLLTVNQDILVAIVSLLGAQDARSLSRTGRKVHLVSKQQALVMTRIHLKDPTGLSDFCRYVLADAANLMHCVRELVVAWGAFRTPNSRRAIVRSFGDLPLLANVLQMAVRLETLHIFDVDALIKDEPRVKEGIIALSHLDSLLLQNIGPRTSDLFSLMQSTPRSLTALFVRRSSTSDILFHSSPLLHLSPFQNLRHLVIGGLLAEDVVSCKAFDGVQKYNGPKWPIVRSLRIEDSSVPLPVLLDAFPSLETLFLQNVMVVDTEQAMPWRRLKRVEEHHSNALCENAFTYESCRLALGRYCPIEPMGPTLRSAELASLSVFWEDGLPEGLNDFFPNIRIFEITVCLDRPDIGVDTNTLYSNFLSRCPGGLRPLNPFCVMLGFLLEEGALDFGGVVLDELEIIEEFVKVIPSLRYIAVGTSVETDCKWYRVHARFSEAGDTEEVPLPEELSDTVGGRIYEYISSADSETLSTIDDFPSSLFE